MRLAPATLLSATHPRRSAGFTLIELLAVLVILALLATVAAPQVIRYLGRARVDAAKIHIQGLTNAIELYHLDVGRFPSDQEGLLALVERPSGIERWNGPYVRKREQLMDPWNRAYRYRFPGQHGDFDLFTLGADDAEGGAGENLDVKSW
jgi:general secretion pathway protein G